MAAEDYIDFDFFDDEDDIMCKFCGAYPLEWGHGTNLNWVLFNFDGTRHVCNNVASATEFPIEHSQTVLPIKVRHVDTVPRLDGVPRKPRNGGRKLNVR